MNQKTQSLLLALVTVVCWGSLATLGNLLVHLPPFYILGTSFLIGSVPAWFKPRSMFPDLKILLLGVGGFFGYHFLLFYSFRFAPVIEANLINYMWPVILVLISPVFFPENKLRFYHIGGAVLATVGLIFLVMGEDLELKTAHLKGYFLAMGAALTWPLYSVAKKKIPRTSIWAIGGFCLVSSILCLLTHFFTEPRVVLQSHDLWILIILGAGPFGLSFYCWDQALDKGDPRVMGTLAYLTPVISTLGLVIFSNVSLDSSTVLAMVFIIGGVSTGILDFFPLKR